MQKKKKKFIDQEILSEGQKIFYFFINGQNKAKLASKIQRL